MKTLSVKQPWAWLICAGYKDIENRTWKTNHRGKLLIHATANCDNSKWAIDMLGSVPEKPGLYYTSSIIGSVEIVECVQNHASVWAEQGCWNWVLENQILFNQPIKDVKGRLSIWDYDIESVGYLC